MFCQIKATGDQCSHLTETMSGLMIFCHDTSENHISRSATTTTTNNKEWKQRNLPNEKKRDKLLQKKTVYFLLLSFLLVLSFPTIISLISIMFRGKIFNMSSK